MVLESAAMIFRYLPILASLWHHRVLQGVQLKLGLVEWASSDPYIDDSTIALWPVRSIDTPSSVSPAHGTMPHCAERRNLPPCDLWPCLLGRVTHRQEHRALKGELALRESGAILLRALVFFKLSTLGLLLRPWRAKH